MLIDFESVQPDSLTALEQDHFKVIVFVGASQAKVPFEVAASLQRMGANGEYVKISGNGKNALDFHIAFYVGQLAASDPTAFFHIISSDTGFDPLIQHLKSKKIFSARSPSIDEIPLIKNGTKKSPEERAGLYIEKLNQPKATKPRAHKTLTSSVASFFQKKLSESELEAVISAIERSGFLSIRDGKVIYANG